jgi:hypothetical protein
MFIYSPEKIVGNPYVQGSGGAGEDVDIIGLHF